MVHSHSSFSPKRHNKSSMMLYGRDDCIACDGAAPVCDCSKGEQCVLTSRTCSQCPAIQCIKGSSSSGGGVNPGVIAGPVVAVLVIASLALFWFLRRKKRRDLARLEELAARARKAESAGFHLSQPSSPHPPSAHSARTGSQRSFNPSQLPAPPPSASRRSPLPPAKLNAEYYDEQGTHVRVYRGNGTINVGNRDPFADDGSMSTGGSSMSTRIIPIQSGDGEERSEAARRLNAARENLLNPRGMGTPTRPARSPDLDLRLSPPKPEADLRSPGGGLGVSAGQIRDSYLSGNSSAPSFLSGMSYDVHNDAPKIVTSKQVQIGRLQQAEVVHVGRSELLASAIRHDERSPSSPGGSTFGHQQESSLRTLTPTHPSSHLEESQEGLYSEPGSATTDLRFSMGSLAYRDSVSTTSTGRYLARPDQAQSPNIPPPRLPQFEARESMFSTKSYADSLLGTFPMIPPSQHVPPLPTGGGIPQSSSAATLDGGGLSMGMGMGMGAGLRPPTSFKGVGGGGGSGVRNHASRPVTNVSVADSFLGTFPFVPPNMDDLAELPSAALPSAAVTEVGKR